MKDTAQQGATPATGQGMASGGFAYHRGGLTGDNLTFASLSQPAEGWVLNNYDGTFTFDPVMDFRALGVGESRRLSFSYQVTDGRGATETVTATLIVTGRNDGTPMIELSDDVVLGPPPKPAAVAAGPAEEVTDEAPPVDMGAAEEMTDDAPVFDMGAGEAATAEAPVFDAGAGEAATDEAPVFDLGAGEAATAEAPVFDAGAGEAATAEATVFDLGAGEAMAASEQATGEGADAGAGDIELVEPAAPVVAAPVDDPDDPWSQINAARNQSASASATVVPGVSSSGGDLATGDRLGGLGIEEQQLRVAEALAEAAHTAKPGFALCGPDDVSHLAAFQDPEPLAPAAPSEDTLEPETFELEPAAPDPAPDHDAGPSAPVPANGLAETAPVAGPEDHDYALLDAADEIPAADPGQSFGDAPAVESWPAAPEAGEAASSPAFEDQGYSLAPAADETPVADSEPVFGDALAGGGWPAAPEAGGFAGGGTPKAAPATSFDDQGYGLPPAADETPAGDSSSSFGEAPADDAWPVLKSDGLTGGGTPEAAPATSFDDQGLPPAGDSSSSFGEAPADDAWPELKADGLTGGGTPEAAPATSFDDQDYGLPPAADEAPADEAWPVLKSDGLTGGGTPEAAPATSFDDQGLPPAGDSGSSFGEAPADDAWPELKSDGLAGGGTPEAAPATSFDDQGLTPAADETPVADSGLSFGDAPADEAWPAAAPKPDGLASETPEAAPTSFRDTSADEAWPALAQDEPAASAGWGFGEQTEATAGDMAAAEPFPQGETEATAAAPYCFAYAPVSAAGSDLAYEILTQPAEGRVEDRGDGTFEFTPGPALRDLVIGEMCQVEFSYRVLDGGLTLDTLTANIAVIGTGDGPEASGVSFAADEDAASGVEQAAAPAQDDGVEAPLPFGSSDTPTQDDGFAVLPLGTAETPAPEDEIEAPLPLGAPGDRLAIGAGDAAPWPPSGEPASGGAELAADPLAPAGGWAAVVADPAAEDESYQRLGSPVADLAAESGADMPDSIPAFLAEPTEESAVEDAPDEPLPAEPLEDGTNGEPADDAPPAAESFDAVPSDGGPRRSSFRRLTESLVAVPEPVADPKPFEPVETPVEMVAPAGAADDVIGEPLVETPDVGPVADRDEASELAGHEAPAPLEVPASEPATPSAQSDSGADGEIDLAAAYLKAQGGSLTEPAAEAPPARDMAADYLAQSGASDAGGALDEAGGEVLPGMTAADMLDSVIGSGNREPADFGNDTAEQGDRHDTLHVDGVSGGPGSGGWDIELTTGSILETNSDHLLLSEGAAGAVVLDGGAGRIAFENVERIVW